MISKGRLRYLVAIVVPVLVLVLVLNFNNARGFFYLSGNSDPAYFYLINSLNVASGEWVQQITHPGIPSKTSGGITVKVLGVLRGVEDIEPDVLQHPEYYLEAINTAYITLNILALILLGVAAIHLTGSLWWSIFLQGIPFVSWADTVRAFIQVTPESTIFLAGVLLVIVLLRIVAKDDLQSKGRFYSIVFSLIMALGIATKLTFVPLIFIPLILLAGWKERLVFLLLLFIFFNVFMIPAWGHYRFFTDWTINILLHSGKYGTGEPGLIDLAAARHNFTAMLARYHTFIFLALGSLLLLVVINANHKLRVALKEKIEIKVLMAVTIAVISQIMIVSKHYDTHYLLPALILAPFMIYLVISILQIIRAADNTRTVWVRSPYIKGIAILISAVLLFKLQAIVVLFKHLFWAVPVSPEFIMAMLLIFSLLALAWLFWARSAPVVYALFAMLLVLYHARYIDLPGEYRMLQQNKQRGEAVKLYVQENYPGYVQLLMNNASSKLWALKMGGMVDYIELPLYEKMEQLYTHEQAYFLQFWGDTLPVVVDWVEQPELLSVFARDHLPMVLHGSNYNLIPEWLAYVEQATGLKPRLAYEGETESVYVIEGTWDGN